MDLINASTCTRIAVALTFGIGATGCSAIGAGQQEAAPLPPPPPVVDRADQLATLPTDDLYRLIVTPSAADSDAETKPSGETAETVDASDPRFTIDPELLDRISADTTLIFRDGEPGYLDHDGSFVSLAVASNTPGGDTGSDQPGGPSSSGDPLLDSLRDLDGVISANAIGNGSYAVTAVSPGVIDGFDLMVQADTPLVLAADDPYQPYQWALDNTGTNLAGVQQPDPVQVLDADLDGREATAGPRGSGVVVAVIDSGVDFSHPDLAGQHWTNPGETCDNSIDDDGNGFVDDCAGWDFGNEDNSPWSPINGDHGTHVAGIIAATPGNGQGIAGLAPGAKIMNLSVAGPGGMTTSSVARAVRYAVDNGADVINMSLGTSPGTPAQAVIPLIDAVQYAETQQVLVVVAAGNDAVDLSNAPSFPASIGTDNLIVVGASTPAETKASFSNYGPVVDLFAPGELIVSTASGAKYVFMSGTSQASPAVAAVAATFIEKNPDADPITVRNQLIGTADEALAYAGQAANPVRVNAARALGLDPEAQDPSNTEAYVTIGGLAGATPEAVEANITLADPGGQFNQPYHWEASIIAVTRAGDVFGIVDHVVDVNGSEARTDGRGAFVLGSSDVGAANLRTALPVGTYALLVEAIPDTDGTVRLGEAFVATFDVGSPDELEDEQPDPGSDGSNPDPGDGGTGTGGEGDGGQGSDSSNPDDPDTTNPGSSDPGTGSGGSDGGSTPDGGDGDTGTSTGSGGSGADGTTGTTSPSNTDGGDGGSTETTGGTTGGDSSDSTPTTAASTTTTAGPTTTRRPGDSAPTDGTTTTVSTTTGGGDAPGSETTPGGVSDGDWSITRISPDSGPINLPNLVTLTGAFPDLVYVWFGDQPGEVVYHSGSLMLVLTPPTATTGPVDVELRLNARRLTLPGGFTFIDPGSGDGGTTDPGGTGSGTGGTGSDDTGSSDTIATTTPTTITPSLPSETTSRTETTVRGGPGEGNDEDGPKTQRQARAAVLGDPVNLDNGLRGTPLSGLETIGGVPRCTSDPCRTRRTG